MHFKETFITKYPTSQCILPLNCAATTTQLLDISYFYGTRLSSHSSRLALFPFSFHSSLYFTYFFIQVHFNIILPHTPNSLQCPLLFGFCCHTVGAFFIATYFAWLIYVYLITIISSSARKLIKLL
jgi:hypothetical protein